MKSRFFALTLFLIILNISVMGQTGSGPLGPTPQTSPQEDPRQAELKRKMMKEANKQRQAQIQKDTEKLLKLATELKEYVEKTNQDILSVDVVKKADEIEKLAHSVKEKMKTSY